MAMCTYSVRAAAASIALHGQDPLYTCHGYREAALNLVLSTNLHCFTRTSIILAQNLRRKSPSPHEILPRELNARRSHPLRPQNAQLEQ